MTLTFAPPRPPRAPTPARTPAPPRSRHALVAAGVLAVHALALWAVLTAQPTPAPEPLEPPQVISATLIAPDPKPPSRQPEPVKPAPKAVTMPRPAAPPQPAPVPLPQPARPVTSTPSPVAPSSAPQAAPAAPAAASTHATASPQAAAPAAPAATPSPAAAPKVELPSTSADYLNNPKPPYPPLSKRLNEQGLVVLRVHIEADGSASKAEIRTSSGYDRLDQAALQTVLRWRYVPGKRGGVAEAMWFNVPINFVLE